MMIQKTIFRALVFLTVTAAAAIAQTIAVNGTLTATIAAPAGVGIVSGVAGGPLNGVTGKPYSAQQETQTVQTLADGTHITSGAQKVTYYRDSLGRTRTERTPMRMPGFMGAAATPPVFVEIVDPVGGYRYAFDSNSHTARRTPFAPPVTSGKIVTRTAIISAAPIPKAVAQSSTLFTSANGVGTQGPRPETSSEQLGARTIEGVIAEGVRTTTTYPVGFLGNDRPISTVRETWTSPELGMDILTNSSDPRNGETTMKLTNISLAEPDPSLFRPPADYEIVDPQK